MASPKISKSNPWSRNMTHALCLKGKHLDGQVILKGRGENKWGLFHFRAAHFLYFPPDLFPILADFSINLKSRLSRYPRRLPPQDSWLPQPTRWSNCILASPSLRRSSFSLLCLFALNRLCFQECITSWTEAKLLRTSPSSWQRWWKAFNKFKC